MPSGGSKKEGLKRKKAEKKKGKIKKPTGTTTKGIRTESKTRLKEINVHTLDKGGP